MKISHQDLKLMLLRPAVYNGKQIEIKISFNESSLFRVDYSTAEALAMKPGDTAYAYGKICFDNALDYEFATVYMSEKLLTEFIEKYGLKPTAAIDMRVELVYALNDCANAENSEIIGFKLLEILSEEVKNNPSSPEIRDYFTDGMK